LKELPHLNFIKDGEISRKFIELLSINYYDIEMHIEFRGLITLLRRTLGLLKYPEYFFQLLNNQKLFFHFLAFSFAGFKRTIFSLDKLKSQFNSIVFVELKAILENI